MKNVDQLSRRLHQASFRRASRDGTSPGQATCLGEPVGGEACHGVARGEAWLDANSQGMRAMNEKFSYVYILTSKNDSSRHYTGLTNNLDCRLNAHTLEKSLRRIDSDPGK